MAGEQQAEGYGADWQGALDFLRGQLVKVDEYVDRHNLYGDLQAINDEYTPATMKEVVFRALTTMDEQLSYWAAKAAGAGGVKQGGK